MLIHSFHAYLKTQKCCQLIFELGRNRRPFHCFKRDSGESLERVVFVEKCDMRDLVQDESARSQVCQGVVFDQIYSIRIHFNHF